MSVGEGSSEPRNLLIILCAPFDKCSRLRVVSNVGDGDCGAGEIHTRAREISRRRNAKGVPKNGDSNFRRSLRFASP